jgi:hypothetical protein
MAVSARRVKRWASFFLRRELDRYIFDSYWRSIDMG